VDPPAVPGVGPDATAQGGAEVAGSPAQGDVPARALRAYQAAALAVQTSDPSCGLDWALLAGIGRVESNHGRYGGSRLDTDGVARPLIIGIPLDGRPGVARIGDSDRGVFDGDTTFDRAVGPMQFIPGTWARSGADGDGDGRLDPHDIDDAALAAARYLCAGDARVSDVPGALAALMRYNHSVAYGVRVLGLAAAYRRGVSVDESTVSPPPAVSTTPAAPAPAPEVTAAVVTVVAVVPPTTDSVEVPAVPPVGTVPAASPADEPAAPTTSTIEPVACLLLGVPEGTAPETAAPESGPAAVPATSEPDGASATSSSATLCDPVAYAAQLVKATNDARAAELLPPLVGSECAQAAALERAADLVGVAELTSASLAGVITSCSATTAAENLSRGVASPAAVLAAWLASPGDRADLVSTELTGIGVGCVLDGDEMLCSQVYL